MTPPPEDAKRRVLAGWLAKAKADLDVAEHLLAEGAEFPNAVAFHCQQAAEKYLKALLAWIEIEFPKTHDLEILLNLIEPTHGAVVSQLQDIITLTPYGVELRYPGDRPDASPEEAHDAVQLAQRVRDAVMPLLPDTSTRDEN